MNAAQIKQNIAIIDFLKSRNYKPERIRGQNAWYNLDESKNRASQSVNMSLNLWSNLSSRDSIKGGSIIDLVMWLDGCDFTTAINCLNSDYTKGIPKADRSDIPQGSSPQIHTIKPIGNNRALTDYLTSRDLNIAVAAKYLREVYYHNDKGKHFFALGFQNRSKGYELRNKHFKGSIGKKDITHITHGKDTITVFEGFTDFLSLLTLKAIPMLKSDVLVLNSTTMLHKALPIIKDYTKAFTALDNDHAGHTTTSKIQEVMPTKTLNYLYAGYEDLNHFLTKSSTV